MFLNCLLLQLKVGRIHNKCGLQPNDKFFWLKPNPCFLFITPAKARANSKKVNRFYNYLLKISVLPAALTSIVTVLPITNALLS
jgi:hypothetical protein